jgi:hypothetical protein
MLLIQCILLRITYYTFLHINLQMHSIKYTTVIKKYGECLNKKNYYSKRHIAINPPQNTPPRFEHTYSIVLATF